jgi:hypothetical protein
VPRPEVVADVDRTLDHPAVDAVRKFKPPARAKVYSRNGLGV